jgi:hypothetical protein
MKLPHRILIERATAGAEDERGMPGQTWATLADGIPAFVQPLQSEELAQLSQGGPVASDHAIYLLPTDLRESDRIRFDPSDGRVFQVDGIRDEAGLGHHLKVMAHMVEAQ